MRSQIPHANCRWSGEDPSNFHAEMWPDEWDYWLECEFRRRFGAQAAKNEKGVTCGAKRKGFQIEGSGDETNKAT